ncbi:MAG: cupin domain-containing protein [Ktedonobacterales bacterium]
MQRFDLAMPADETRQLAHPYHEFLRVHSMSAGVYSLAAGATDSQQPHTEDELYVILRGSATLRVGDEDAVVTTGSAVFVPARVAHHFHSITEDLAVLVMFAPAEYSQATARS